MTKTIIELLKKDHIRKTGRDQSEFDKGVEFAFNKILFLLEMDNTEVKREQV